MCDGSVSVFFQNPPRQGFDAKTCGGLWQIYIWQQRADEYADKVGLCLHDVFSSEGGKNACENESSCYVVGCEHFFLLQVFAFEFGGEHATENEEERGDATK